MIYPKVVVGNLQGIVDSGFIFDGHPTPTTVQTLRDPGGNVTSRMVSNTQNEIKNRNFTGNLNWKHTFDSTGKEVMTDVDYVRYTNTSDLLLSTDFYNHSLQL